MAKLTKPDLRVMLKPIQLTSYQGTGTVIEASQHSRPFWFNGRFLAANDLRRDQDFFLMRQAVLGKAAGSGVIHGLQVTIPPDAPADAETFVVSAGLGLTPGGYLVMLGNDLKVVLSDLADAEDLDAQFGLSEAPTPVARTRTGLFIIALRPVEFTANPITSYPVSIQGTRTTHDGNIVEATAVSLVPYPDPTSNYDASTRQAAVARSIFLLGSTGPVNDSLLPIAMISIQGGVIEWIDQWMVRRNSGPESSHLRLNLKDAPVQQAFLLQYDAQLQQVVNGPAKAKTLSFAASDYFQALPPCGRLPLAAIDTTRFTQIFFPPQTNVLLNLVPEDELPALIEDSLSLQPIDLTQPAASFADLAVYILVPVTRQQYAALSPTLTPVALTAALPQVLNNRRPLELLKFFPTPIAVKPPAPSWNPAIANQTYGYYIVRRSVPVYVMPTTVAIAAVPGTAAGAFTLTASVSPETATGTVTFMDGAASLGTATLDKQGSGTLAVTGLASGTHQLSATYGGDTFFAASSSATVQETV
jgi:hypothetical protein